MVKTSPVTKRQNWEQREPGSGACSLALVVVCLAIFLDALDVSIVTIALPNIQRDLHVLFEISQRRGLRQTIATLKEWAVSGANA